MKLNRKFSLATFLIVVTAIALGFGYVNNQRENGSDRFTAMLEKIGGFNYESSSDLFQPKKFDTSFWARITGNTHKVERAVHFGFTKIDAKTGRALARNVAANGPVYKVTFYQSQIDDQCPCFLWDSVTHVEFEDTATLPDSWIDAMAASPSLKRVAFSGAEMDISISEISKLKNLRFPRLSNLGIYGDRLTQIENALPHAKIRTSGLWGKPWPFATEETLSSPNALASKEIREALDELKAELAKLDPPATNQFNPPATLAEIAKLEQSRNWNTRSADLYRLIFVHCWKFITVSPTSQMR